MAWIVVYSYKVYIHFQARKKIKHNLRQLLLEFKCDIHTIRKSRVPFEMKSFMNIIHENNNKKMKSNISLTKPHYLLRGRK